MATNLSEKNKICGQAPPTPIWQKGYLTMSKNKVFHYRVDFVNENIEISNEAFDIAVRMFPSDPAANLNAANASMQKGDMAAAKRYLEKAGDSPQADYARGVWSAINADYMKAKGYFSLTADSIPQVKEALSIVEYLLEVEIP